jgi:hypothetical protein
MATQTTPAAPEPTAPGPTGAAATLVARDSVDAAEAASTEVYDAEIALHIARQTGVDAWVAAAYDHLHAALEHERAVLSRQSWPQ